MPKRLLSLAGALAFGLILLTTAPGLLHPADILPPWRDPCTAPGLADALAYGVLATIAVLAALAAAVLARRQGPSWLAVSGLGLVAIGWLTRQSGKSFACVGVRLAGEPPGYPYGLAFALAALAVAAGCAAWLWLQRRWKAS